MTWWFILAGVVAAHLWVLTGAFLCCLYYSENPESPLSDKLLAYAVLVLGWPVLFGVVAWIGRRRKAL
jgi:membrane protein DedA with SNARE-associated domain